MSSQSRRSFFRRALTGAAGVAAGAVSGVTGAAVAAREQAAAERVIEKIVQVPAPLVYATSAFGYGTLQLEAGEVFALTGLRNDELLRTHGYADPIPEGTALVECNCGRRFVCPNGTAFLHGPFFFDHQEATGHKRKAG